MKDQYIDKIFKEPVWEEFDENTHRIRRNLLWVSTIALIVVLNSLTIKDVSIEGMKIDGLNTSVIKNTLFFLVLYQFLHFIVVAWNYILHWRIRITGITTHRAILASPSVEDSKQASLYLYWLVHKNSLRNFPEYAKEFSELNQTVMRYLSATYQQDRAIYEKNFDKIRTSLSSISASLTATKEIIEGKHIEESLRRFDSWFKCFQISQLIRWLFIELLTPLLISGIALYLTFPTKIIESLISIY